MIGWSPATIGDQDLLAIGNPPLGKRHTESPLPFVHCCAGCRDVGLGLAQNNLSLLGVKHNPVDGSSNEITRTILVSDGCVADGRCTGYRLPQGIDHDLFYLLSPDARDRATLVLATLQD